MSQLPPQTPEFRMRPGDKKAFLSQVTEAVKPFSFLTFERVEGDEIVIMVFLSAPASLKPRKALKLTSKLHLSKKGEAGQADKEEDF